MGCLGPRVRAFHQLPNNPRPGVIAKYGILDEISLVRDCPDWWGFGANFYDGVDFAWCSTSLVQQRDSPGAAQPWQDAAYLYVFSGKVLEKGIMQHKLSWHKGNYKRLNVELREIDWEFELKYLDASNSFTVCLLGF